VAAPADKQQAPLSPVAALQEAIALGDCEEEHIEVEVPKTALDYKEAWIKELTMEMIFETFDSMAFITMRDSLRRKAKTANVELSVVLACDIMQQVLTDQGHVVNMLDHIAMDPTMMKNLKRVHSFESGELQPERAGLIQRAMHKVAKRLRGALQPVTGRRGIHLPAANKGF
jgi:hypothetical protein